MAEEGFVEKKNESAKEADNYQQDKVRKKQDLFLVSGQGQLTQSYIQRKRRVTEIVCYGAESGRRCSQQLAAQSSAASG